MKIFPNKRLMDRLVFVCTLLFVVLVSCKENKERQVKAVVQENLSVEDSVIVEPDTLELFEEEVLPVSADYLFNDFFYNFASDMNFQRQRIVFPVRCENCDTVVKCSRADWNDELVVDDYYTILYEREEEIAFQQDTSVAEVTVERINLDIDEVDFFQFRRIEGKWMMTGVRHEPIPETTNSDFLEFYHVFSSDSTHRAQHVAEPVRFILSSEEGEEDEIQDLSADEWSEVAADLSIPAHTIVNINYGQTCISRNSKLLLVAGISNGLSMRYRFTKIDGRWMLVEVRV